MSRFPRHIVIAAHAWYGDTIGGAFRLASEFAEHLSSIGHHVTYVCSAPRIRGEKDYVPLQENVGCGRLRVVRYPALARRTTGLGRLRYHVVQTSRLVSSIQDRHAIDYVNGHSPLQFMGALRPLRAANTWRVFTVHSPFDDELLSNASGGRTGLSLRIAATVARWVDGRNIRSADCVQTVSKYTLDTLGRKHGIPSLSKKGTVTPGWVDTRHFHPIGDRCAERGNLGEAYNTDAPIFFTLRRLEARMGLDCLVQAAHQLKRKGSRFRVLIGGDGSLREKLQRMIDDLDLRDTVYLVGRIPTELITKYYASANCFILPTRALECFGLIVLEAFASNTPVIASDVAAIPEVAARQGKAWLFPPGDSDTLARKMQSFLDRELVAPSNLRAIAEEYDREKILQKWTDLLLGGDRP